MGRKASLPLAALRLPPAAVLLPHVTRRGFGCFCIRFLTKPVLWTQRSLWRASCKGRSGQWSSRAGRSQWMRRGGGVSTFPDPSTRYTMATGFSASPSSFPSALVPGCVSASRLAAEGERQCSHTTFATPARLALLSPWTCAICTGRQARHLERLQICTLHSYAIAQSDPGERPAGVTCGCVVAGGGPGSCWRRQCRPPEMMLMAVMR